MTIFHVLKYRLDHLDYIELANLPDSVYEEFIQWDRPLNTYSHQDAVKKLTELLMKYEGPL